MLYTLNLNLYHNSTLIYSLSALNEIMFPTYDKNTQEKQGKYFFQEGPMYKRLLHGELPSLLKKIHFAHFEWRKGWESHSNTVQLKMAVEIVIKKKRKENCLNHLLLYLFIPLFIYAFKWVS